MAWVFAVLTLVVSAFVFVVVAFLLGVLIPPIYEEVMASEAVTSLGYDQGVEVATRIGLRYILPIMIIVLIVWFTFLMLRRDDYKGQVQTRR